MGELDLWQRVTAAGGAGILSSLIVTPLDVVKTRMQTQASATRSARPAYGTFATAGLTPWLQHGALELPYLHRPADAAPKYRSATQSLGTIAKHEGLASLWQGTNLGLLIAVPLVAIYLPLYDLFSAQLSSNSSLGYFTPLVAGCGARAVAALAISPMELVKTRMQAAQRPQSIRQQPLTIVLDQLKQESQGSRLQQVRSLWRGIGATLAKDLPFAGVYWMLLEPARTTVVPAALATLLSMRNMLPGLDYDVHIRDLEHDGAAALAPSPATGPLAAHLNTHLGAHADPSSKSTSPQSGRFVQQSVPRQRHSTDLQRAESNASREAGHTALAMPSANAAEEAPQSTASIVAVNAVAAALAAGLAGALSTPLDVAKTYAQTSEAATPPGTVKTLMQLWQRGGMRSLFAGAGPRTVRTVAAYSILMSSYELCKGTYGQER